METILGVLLFAGWDFCHPGYTKTAGERDKEKQAAVTATVVIDARPWRKLILERSALTEPVKKR